MKLRSEEERISEDRIYFKEDFDEVKFNRRSKAERKTEHRKVRNAIKNKIRQGVYDFDEEEDFFYR